MATENKETLVPLRDWLAGQALNGMIAHGVDRYIRDKNHPNWGDLIASEAYLWADCMLAQREKGQTHGRTETGPVDG